MQNPERGRKMKTKVSRLAVLSLVFVLAGFVLVSLPDHAPVAEARHEIQLQAPPFLDRDALQAGSTPFNIGEYLDDEAGISAWYESPMAIDLDDVRDRYKIIERETESYIIGSVSVSGYEDKEIWDQHVYVHVDGWILAYYFNTRLTGRMVDVYGHTINSTLLENTVAEFAGLAGLPYTGATLYDFRYPNATHMLFVYEDDVGGTTYTINMPMSYAYLERSWAKHNTCYGAAGLQCDFRIDGTQAPVAWKGYHVCIGTIPYAQLQPGVTHTVDVDGLDSDYATLIITYAVP
jgi:hypothetical protein